MSGSVTFLSFIVCIGVFLGLYIGLFLLLNRSLKSKSNIYLAMMAIMPAIHLLCPFAYFIGIFEEATFLYRSERFIGFLSGPILYFYVLSCTQQNFKLRSILWLHFIPAFIDLFFHIPILQIPAELKIEYFSQFMETGIFQGINEPRIIPLAKPIVALIYGIISLRVVLSYRKHLSETTSSIDEALHRWLVLFCSFKFYPILIVIAFLTFGGVNLNVYYFVFFSLILAMLTAILVKPQLFRVFPHQMPIPNSTEEKTQKYEKSSLQKEKKERFLQKLLNHVEEHRPYLESDLTLAELSNQTQIPSHYLSQVINEKLDCTFLDFINGYRIKEAKRMLTEEDSKKYTILSIAYDAGFNSKSAFYTAFKKHTDMTPSAFRKTHLQNS